jgi:mRNA interferase YafQ
MYSLEFTNQYLKDLKRARRRHFNEESLNMFIKILLTGTTLPSKHKEHRLKGKYMGLFECHITPDWLLIYSKEQTLHLITLIRTGTHSDLF